MHKIGKKEILYFRLFVFKIIFNAIFMQILLILTNIFDCKRYRSEWIAKTIKVKLYFSVDKIQCSINVPQKLYFIRVKRQEMSEN